MPGGGVKSREGLSQKAFSSLRALAPGHRGSGGKRTQASSPIRPQPTSEPSKQPRKLPFSGQLWDGLGWTCAYQCHASPCSSARRHILGKLVDRRDVAGSPLRRCCTLPCVHSILGDPRVGGRIALTPPSKSGGAIGANCSRLGGGWSHVHPANDEHGAAVFSRYPPFSNGSK